MTIRGLVHGPPRGFIVILLRVIRYSSRYNEAQVSQTFAEDQDGW